MAFERAVSSALPSMHDIKLIKSETSGFPWRGLCVRLQTFYIACQWVRVVS